MYGICAIANTRNFGSLVDGAGNAEFQIRGASVIQSRLALWGKIQLPIMPQSPSRLAELWLKRGSLEKDEIEALYVLLRKLLKPIASRICSNLPDTPDEYVHQFAIEKALELSPNQKSNFQFQGDRETEAYIRSGFKLFASDIRKSTVREYGVVDYVDTEELEGYATPFAGNGESLVDILAAAGLSIEEADEHAGNVMGTLSREEKLFLFHHTCMDYDDKRAEREFGKGAVPLSKLTQQFAIKNYYRKAKELGITGMQAGYVADFAQSKLGRWMKRCGLRIDKDHRGEMIAMLAILCSAIFLDAENERNST